MRIVIYLGNFQHDVVNDFAKSVGAVFERNGAEVFYIDVRASVNVDEFHHIFKSPVDFVLGFNGLGYEVMDHDRSFYDAVNTVYVMWLVDHPVHLMDRVKAPIKNKVVICIDETHLDYIEKYISDDIITSFIPHAVNDDKAMLSSEKIYDVTFAGHINELAEFDTAMQQLEQIEPQIKLLINRKLNEEGNIHLGNLLETLFERQPSFKLNCEQNPNLQVQVLYTLDLYIRAVKRNYIIQQLLNNGITINFFGNIPANHSFINHPLFKQHGSVGFDQLKAVYRQSKMVLNVLPNFPNGSHERIFTSMMCGALPITDTNHYINLNLPSILAFNYSDIQQLAPNISALLNDDILLNNLMNENYKLVVNDHTWENRVNKLMYVVEAAKKLLS